MRFGTAACEGFAGWGLVAHLPRLPHTFLDARSDQQAATSGYVILALNLPWAARNSAATSCYATAFGHELSRAPGHLGAQNHGVGVRELPLVVGQGTLLAALRCADVPASHWQERKLLPASRPAHHQPLSCACSLTTSREPVKPR